MNFKAIPIDTEGQYIQEIYTKYDYKALWRIYTKHLVKTTANKTKQKEKERREEDFPY